MKMKVFFSSLLHTKQITLIADNFLNNDFLKKLIFFIETTFKPLLYTKVSLKLSG